MPPEAPPPAPPLEVAASEVTEFELLCSSEAALQDSFQDMVTFPLDDLLVTTLPKVHRTSHAVKMVGRFLGQFAPDLSSKDGPKLKKVEPHVQEAFLWFRSDWVTTTRTNSEYTSTKDGKGLPKEFVEGDAIDVATETSGTGMRPGTLN